MTWRSRHIQKRNVEHFTKSVFNSYGQVFFSDHRVFSVLLLVVSFFDPYAGACGLISVLATSLAAFLLRFDQPYTARGLYGFNSLLIGLGLGVYYVFSLPLIFIVVLASLFTLFISILLQGVLGKYNLPFLSLPFILSIWVFFQATSGFSALGISERGIYNLNEFYSIGGMQLIHLYESISEISLHEFPKTFFISLSAIFFQYSVLAGIIISAGLLFFSRIAFVLAWLGFGVAWYFYNIIGADITVVDYSYIGFNYILTAIAVGGFFLVPSLRSFISVVILIPMVAVITTGLSSMLLNFKLPVYSLPFSVITLLYLYALKFRVTRSSGLSEVVFQFNSPEKNLYTFQNKQERFKYFYLKSLQLPFFGRWEVSQAHDGEYTHKEQWRHAWDFIITGEDGRQFKNEGNNREDYFCFNKPVVAPADGTIEKVVNDVEDNDIGDVNLEDNWGNTVVIKHDDHTYSKVSHLKKGSVSVEEGMKVKTGELLGKCGNSGRSPYPHLHFQVQPYPYIGSPTMDYPLSHYIQYIDTVNPVFKTWSRPKKGDILSNVETNTLLKNAFKMVPGQIFSFSVQQNGKETQRVDWEVAVNPYNQSYIHCKDTDTFAYFENHGSLFYFTQFYGKKQGLLYHFFLAAYKVQKGNYKNMTIEDQYPLHQVFPPAYLWWIDFVSPFMSPARSVFRVEYDAPGDIFSNSGITLNTTVTNYLIKRTVDQRKYKLEIDEKGIHQLTFHQKSNTITLTRCEKTSY